jgi:hypothetical protein
MQFDQFETPRVHHAARRRGGMAAHGRRWNIGAALITFPL